MKLSLIIDKDLSMLIVFGNSTEPSSDWNEMISEIKLSMLLNKVEFDTATVHFYTKLAKVIMLRICSCSTI